MTGPSQQRWAVKLAALDVNLLVSLDALLEECNVTRAATRLGVTQSAMSQTLARLRDTFDDPILVRVGRNMQPTPFAQRIRSRLHAALVELTAVVQERPQFLPEEASRRFVVATVDYLAQLIAPRLRTALANQAPSVALAIAALDVRDIASSLEAGEIDLYLGVHGATERSLSRKVVFQEPFLGLTRNGHPLLAGKPTGADYAGYPHVHVSPRRERGSIVERALSEAGLVRNVEVEVPYFSLVPDLLYESDLVATIPARLARHFEREYELSAFEPPIALPALEICVAWHPRFEREPGVRWLRELVHEVASTLDGPS